MRSDDAGVRVGRATLAFNLLIFAAGIVIAAGLFAVLNEPVTMLLDSAAANTDESTAADSIQYTRQAWNFLPFFVLVLATVQLVAAASREARL